MRSLFISLIVSVLIAYLLNTTFAGTGDHRRWSDLTGAELFRMEGQNCPLYFPIDQAQPPGR